MTITAAPATKVLKGGAGTGEDGAALQEALEVNGERARVKVAAVWFLLEALQADRLQVARDLGPKPRRRYRVLGSDLFDRVGGRRSAEGRSAREEFIENGAEGVLVDRGAGVMDLAAGLLGRHVVGRTDDGAGASQVRVIPEASSQAKVGDLGTTVGRQEDIRRLEVAVDDTLQVSGVDGAGEGMDGPRDMRYVLRPSVHLLG